MLLLDGVKPAVAPGVAAEDPPAGQNQPAEYAELVDRLRGILRARRVVLAPRSHQRRDQPLIDPDRQAPRASAERSLFTSAWSHLDRRRRAGDAIDQFRQRAADSGQTLTLSQRPSFMARNHDSVRPLRQSRTFERKRLAQQSLHAVALDGATDLPRDRQPQTGRARLFASREHVEHELLARVRAALSEHTIEISAAGQPCSPRPRPRARLQRASDRQPLAAFVATPLERQTARTRLHASPESVRAGALALLWLIGAFHRSRSRGGTIPVYARSVVLLARNRYGRRLDPAAPNSDAPRGPGRSFSRALRQRPTDVSNRPDAAGIFARPELCPAPDPHQDLTTITPPRSRLALPAQLELTHAWREIRAELRRIVGDSTYEIWLASLDAKALGRSHARCCGRRPTPQRGSPSGTDARSSSAAGAVLGDGAGSRSTGAPADAARRTPARRPPGHRRSRPASLAATEAFNPRYSFEQFIIGDGNRLAHAASLAVAELPGQAYNPLFLHAPPGLGKTHLLHAIGNYVLAFGGGTTVRYTTVEAFTNHFITALSIPLARPLQAGLPRRRRPADRRRPVPGQQGQDGRGVLPHLQRAVRDRPAARAHLRPAPAAARRRSRSACASASNRDWWPTSGRPTTRPGSRSCASEPPSTASQLADPASSS